MSGPYTMADVRATHKQRDAWWTVFLVDPIASRLVLWAANRTSVKPIHVTGVAGLLGLAATAAFVDGSRLGLILGAALFYVSFLADCVDGKLARLTDTGSLFGAWLDYLLDRIKIAACTVGLMMGQYLRTDRVIFLYLAIVVLFGEMFRQLHAAHVRELHRTATSKFRSPVRNEESAAAADDGRVSAGTTATAQPVPPLANSPQLGRASGVSARLRAAARANRIRTHLWSGVEFEMFVFIVGPLTGAIIPVTVGSTVLLALFEAAVIVRLYHVTRRTDRDVREAKVKQLAQNGAAVDGRQAASHW